MSGLVIVMGEFAVRAIGSIAAASIQHLSCRIMPVIPNAAYVLSWYNPITKWGFQHQQVSIHAQASTEPPPLSPGFGTWAFLVHVIPFGVLVDGGFSAGEHWFMDLSPIRCGYVCHCGNSKIQAAVIDHSDLFGLKCATGQHCIHDALIVLTLERGNMGLVKFQA